MPNDPNPGKDNPSALELEREILRVFCTLAAPSSVLRSAMLSLDHHSWSDPKHRVLFDALRRIHPGRAAALREELPGMATRMGFPDVDWAPYFQPSKLAPADFEAAVRAVTLVPDTRPPGAKDTRPPRVPFNAKDTRRE
jgi:hypothetical protein